MLLKQSLGVDTTRFEKEGVFCISNEVSALKDYLRKNPKSLYCTPQLIDAEEPLSIMVLRMRKQHKEVLMTMINPVILNIKDTIAVEETQDQVEGTYLNIRHPQLHIAYVALPAGKPQEVTLTGKSALVFQQALRLMQGISIDTFGLRIDDYEDYQNADEEGRQQIIKDYMQALKEINQEMLADEDTKEYVRATEYIAENVQRSVNAEFTGALQDAYAEITSAEAQVVESSKSKKNN